MTQFFLEKEITAESFEKFLLVKLAPVLADVKPALLLGMCNCSKRKKDKNLFANWESNKQEIAGRFGILFKELNYTEKGKQVFFYREKQLVRVLKNKEINEYLIQFGYKPGSSLNESLRHLAYRFNSDTFPHEIGVFLGYPIKDVKGFIEKRGDCVHIKNRWKIYGCPEESLTLHDAYRIAEKVFVDLILQNKNPLNYLEEICDFVLQKEACLSLT